MSVQVQALRKTRHGIDTGKPSDIDPGVGPCGVPGAAGPIYSRALQELCHLSGAFYRCNHYDSKATAACQR